MCNAGDKCRAAVYENNFNDLGMFSSPADQSLQVGTSRQDGPMEVNWGTYNYFDDGINAGHRALNDQLNFPSKNFIQSSASMKILTFIEHTLAQS